MTKIRFQRTANEDVFGRDLQSRVNDYFKGRELSSKSNFEMHLKTTVYLATYIVAYALLISNQFGAAGTFALWVLLGILIPGIGFNIGHDAIHGAYSHKPWVNRLLGESFSLIGADVRTWKILHNTIHHSYTNIWNADGDLKPVPFLRFHSSSEHRWWHRAQSFYAPILYCFTSLVWIFRKDYQFLFKAKHLVYRMPKVSSGDIVKLIFVKATYYLVFLAAPLILISAPWWQILLGFLSMHFVAGFILAMVFQLGHIVEGPSFYDLLGGEAIPGSWNELQLRSSSNFSMNSVGLWLFGGLNYQIEHHLFPKVCHVHYPAISKIVQEVAAKHSLTYNFHPRFLGALGSHFRTLSVLSRSA